ncbi:MAG: hypothetical protein ACD_11C00053G0011 [uncultured bacterium]|nr:MAG: hypothetical protein ACD_11C00053G0011 [uncultured bacterium]HBR71879.1 hypothetical protein [Candidatus Moranbacteria bacterium]
MAWKKVVQIGYKCYMNKEKQKDLGDLSEIMHYDTCRVDLIVDYLRKKGLLKPKWYLISKTIHSQAFLDCEEVRFDVGIPREDNYNCLEEGIGVLIEKYGSFLEIFVSC